MLPLSMPDIFSYGTFIGVIWGYRPFPHRCTAGSRIWPVPRPPLRRPSARSSSSDPTSSLPIACHKKTVQKLIYLVSAGSIHTVFDLISEHALISGHPPFFFLIIILFLFFIIISSDFREGNTSLLYTGLMATRALTLRVRLLGQILKKDNIIFLGGGKKIC